MWAELRLGVDAHRVATRLCVRVDQPLGEERDHAVERRAQRAAAPLEERGQHTQDILTDGDVALGERMREHRK